MAQSNTHLDDNYFFKFKEIETILKCRIHEETLIKIIDIAYKQLKKGGT